MYINIWNLDRRIDSRFRLDVQLAQQILPIQFSQTTALLWGKQNCSLETNFAVPIFNVIVHDFMTMSHTTAPTHSQTNAMMILKYGFRGTERPNFFLSLLKSLSKIFAKSWNIHISGRHYVQKEHPLKGHFFPGKITKTHIGEIYYRVLAISTAISLLRVCIEKKILLYP